MHLAAFVPLGKPFWSNLFTFWKHGGLCCSGLSSVASYS